MQMGSGIWEPQKPLRKGLRFQNAHSHGKPQEMASEAILSRVYNATYVHEHSASEQGIEVRISASDDAISILMSNHGKRIELK